MYKLLAKAEFDPVTLEDFKAHLRISHDSQDYILEQKLKAAVRAAEQFLRRALVTSDWQLNLDLFPQTGGCIYIAKCPVTEISKIEYLNTSGVWTEWDDENYSIDIDNEPARVYE